MIPQLCLLEKLTIVKYDRDSPDKVCEVLTKFPDIHKIHNENLNELIISAHCDFIPYLANFPAVKRIEIVSDLNYNSYIGYATGNNRIQRKREFVDLNTRIIPDRKQQIRDYCERNNIQLII